MTVDDVKTQSSDKGTYQVLDDKVAHVSVTMVVGEKGNLSSHKNWVDVLTPNYEIVVSYGYGDADVVINALNAGACQTPGGFLGQTFIAGTPIAKSYADFLVNGAYDTKFQFDTPCGGASPGSGGSQAMIGIPRVSK